VPVAGLNRAPPSRCGSPRPRGRARRRAWNCGTCGISWRWPTRRRTGSAWSLSRFPGGPRPAAARPLEVDGGSGHLGPGYGPDRERSAGAPIITRCTATPSSLLGTRSERLPS